MVDVPIHEENTAVQETPLVDVVQSKEKVDANAVLKRLTKLEKKVEAMSKINHTDAIEEFVYANVINEVKNQLPKFLSKAVSEYIQPRMERTKSHSFLEHENHLELYNALINSTGVDKAVANGDLDDQSTLKKRRHDQDPPADADKDTKKRRKRILMHPTGDAEETIQDDDVDAKEGPTFALLKGNYKNSINLEYNMEHCYLALMDQIDWAKPKGDRCPYDLNKPLALQGPPGRTTIPVDFFFNKDLEYLKTRNKEKKYDLLFTKPKAVRDPNVNASIDQDMRYGYFKEIVVRRADQHEYIFNEADFPILHLNNIKDMYLLKIQNKLHHLTSDEQYGLVNA
ncbi:hypothetical protein Tco_0787520 [Tanacetum coccineum]